MLLDVQPFWKEVGKLISEILDLKTDLSFALLYLGHTHQGLSKGDMYLLKILMAASKKTPPPPHHRRPINIINCISLMEKMTFTIRIQKENGDAYWHRWDCYNHINIH